MKTAKKKEKYINYEKQALQILEDCPDIYFLNDLADEMGISLATFYFQKLEKSEAIKKALLYNRRRMKRGLRNKWYKSNNPTLQIALYRITADEDELRRLNNKEDNQQDGDGNGILEKLLKANLDIQTKKGKK